jgi:anti-sigma B factor antagonist
MLIQMEKDVLIFSLEEEVVQEDVELLQKKLLDLLAEGHLKVVLDMAQCSYITSMGLSAIFHAKKRYNEKGGDIRIARVNSLIRNLLTLTNLNKTIRSFETLNEAIQSFSL